MEVKLEVTKKIIHGIKVVHVKTNNLMSYFAFHCLSGSYHENEENQGVSHYLEHMFFKGTTKREVFQVSDDAAILGATQNAFTSEIDTCYYLTAPATNYDGCIELLSDMMFNSTFPEDEIEKERTVIQAERKSYEDTPSSSYFMKLQNQLFDFKLGHDIIGTEETIDGISRNSLVDFKNNCYGSNNTIFLVISAIDSDKIFESCEDYFENNGLFNVDVTSLDFKIVKELKDVEFTRENIQQSYLSMVFDSIKYNDKNNTFENCARLYLGGGLYGLLPKEVREKLGLCYHIGYYSLEHTPYDGVSCIYTLLDEDNVDKAKEAIVNSLKSLSEGNIDESLFDCAKAQMLADYCYKMDDPKKLSRKVALLTLYDFDINVEEKYNEIVDLQFDDFAVYLKNRAKNILENHCWAVMSPNGE
jgi:predicted Zn-dependent peptidase